MNIELLNDVGKIVASEIHGLSSWFGETETFYVKTDINPNDLQLSQLKKNIVDIRDKPFDGCFWIIAYRNIM